LYGDTTNNEGLYQVNQNQILTPATNKEGNVNATGGSITSSANKMFGQLTFGQEK
jgi:hypothetical protein